MTRFYQHFLLTDYSLFTDFTHKNGKWKFEKTSFQSLTQVYPIPTRRYITPVMDMKVELVRSVTVGDICPGLPALRQRYTVVTKSQNTLQEIWSGTWQNNNLLLKPCISMHTTCLGHTVVVVVERMFCCLEK